MSWNWKPNKLEDFPLEAVVIFVNRKRAIPAYKVKGMQVFIDETDFVCRANVSWAYKYDVVEYLESLNE